MGGSEKRIHLLVKLSLSLLKTPVIAATVAGMLFSWIGLLLPEFLSSGLKSFGTASVSCTLFSVGILVVQLKMRFPLRVLTVACVIKLLAQPLVTGVLLAAFGVDGEGVLMGMVLGGLSSGAVMSTVAETYSTGEAETAATLLLTTLLYMPALYLVLVVAGWFGLGL